MAKRGFRELWRSLAALSRAFAIFRLRAFASFGDLWRHFRELSRSFGCELSRALAIFGGTFASFRDLSDSGKGTACQVTSTDSTIAPILESRGAPGEFLRSLPRAEPPSVLGTSGRQDSRIRY